jgi:signal transduction histidine kinase
VQLAVVGFLAIYVPVLVLLGVMFVTEDVDETVDDTVRGVEVADDSAAGRSPWATWTAIALGPIGAGLAWWWAGRAVRPIEQVRSVAEEIEGADLSRRIGLDRGPTEVMALAASFDAMLGRLEDAAVTQRRLIEETSHELRTPLSVLVAGADVLLAHPAPTVEVYREGTLRSRAAAVRLGEAIDELLVDARGRARTIDRRPADLMALVGAVVDEARVVAAARRIDVSLVGPAALECPVDRATLRRAVANLIDNAVRYSPSGSPVEVEVVAADGEARVVVTDHGPGIAAQDQGRMFDRFWRGRPDRGGTGLGLPIANQVALAHGGALTVRSPGPAGDGCVFELTVTC